MSCDVAVSAALLLASLNPGQAPGPAMTPKLIPAVAGAQAAGNPLAREPLFAGIIGEAKALNTEVETYRKTSRSST